MIEQPTKEQVQEVMAGLPDDPVAIALAFWEHGITGVTLDAPRCPIAVYFRIRFPGVKLIQAAAMRVYVGQVSVRTTDAVRRFVVAFDSGSDERFARLEVTP